MGKTESPTFLTLEDVENRNRQIKEYHFKVKLLRGMRKDVNRRNKEKYRKRSGNVIAFGYWKYWYLEGKIAPEEQVPVKLGKAFKVD